MYNYFSIKKNHPGFFFKASESIELPFLLLKVDMP